MSYAFEPRRMGALALSLLLITPAYAWNGVGHRAVAGVAYDRLTSRARDRVDQMIRAFPDYDLLVREAQAPGDLRRRARAVFMTAAFWPDIIKGDARFYDEARRNAVPTPPAAGFPDMKQRQNWHYVNMPFSTDGTPVREAPVPNVLTQLKVILNRIGRPPVEGKRLSAEEDVVYLLPWLLHLAGDVHQPLHCGTRFRKGQNDPNGRPWSDLGGNTVEVLGVRNLHALWDDALGITFTPTYVDSLVSTLLKRAPKQPGSLDPEVWVNEGLEIAKRDVYSFGNRGGTKADPLRLNETYMLRMREIAISRAAVGGIRLAAVLNERLR
jgi:hypothetical protein